MPVDFAALLLGVIILVLCALSPCVGMFVASGALTIATVVTLNVSKTAMHDVAAACLFVGAIMSAGIAGMAWQLRPQNAPRTPDAGGPIE